MGDDAEARLVLLHGSSWSRVSHELRAETEAIGWTQPAPRARACPACSSSSAEGRALLSETCTPVEQCADVGRSEH